MLNFYVDLSFKIQLFPGFRFLENEIFMYCFFTKKLFSKVFLNIRMIETILGTIYNFKLVTAFWK